MDDDDIPQLSAETLKALQDFRDEKDAREKEFDELKSKAESQFDDGGKLSMALFGEDWNASQFWYTDETARILARQLLHEVSLDSAIAIVSAPSVYVALRNILAEEGNDLSRPTLRLFEFDKRFEIFGSDFVFYDYQNPLRLPPELKGRFDRIIADPPFLSEDCQTKTALSVRYLARSWDSLRFISSTGERMESTITKLYSKIGVRTTTFEPRHAKGLSNEFRCYANFECPDWTWRA